MSLHADDPRGADRRRERRSAWRGLDESSIMGVELLAATLTWAGIGYLADRWLGTGPWLLAIGALVGNAAGIYLIWLRSGRMHEAAAAERQRGSADATAAEATTGETGGRLVG